MGSPTISRPLRDSACAHLVIVEIGVTRPELQDRGGCPDASAPGARLSQTHHHIGGRLLLDQIRQRNIASNSHSISKIGIHGQGADRLLHTDRSFESRPGSLRELLNSAVNDQLGSGIRLLGLSSVSSEAGNSSWSIVIAAASFHEISFGSFSVSCQLSVYTRACLSGQAVLCLLHGYRPDRVNHCAK